jgi:hypothetical protein
VDDGSSSPCDNHTAPEASAGPPFLFCVEGVASGGTRGPDDFFRDDIILYEPDLPDNNFNPLTLGMNDEDSESDPYDSDVDGDLELCKGWEGKFAREILRRSEAGLPMGFLSKTVWDVHHQGRWGIEFKLEVFLSLIFY